MGTRSWRCWLLAAVVVLAGWVEAPAEPVRLIPSSAGTRRTDPPAGAERPSHRPLGGLADHPNPEAELAGRLFGPRTRQQMQDQVDRERIHKELQQQAARLLKDEKFREKVLKGRKLEDLERLKKKVENGEGLKDDPLWKDLLKDGVSAGQLSRREENLLRRWAESLPEAVISGPQTPHAGERAPFSPAPTAPAGGYRPPGESGTWPEPRAPWTRLREWAGGLVEEHMDDWLSTLDEWLDSPVGQSWRDAVREAVLTRMPEGFKGSDVSDNANTLARYLPRVQDLLPKDWASLLGRRGLPAVPRVGSLPSAGLHAAPSAPGKETAGVVLWLLLLAVLAAALWRSASWYRERARGGRPWRLGPWPVRPGEVSTREELVRAFEHLALLLLGPSARTRHHLDLARRMGGQPALDSDRRGEAARELAALYEQARYAPEPDPLGADELAAARRDLCYLAGVSAA